MVLDNLSGRLISIHAPTRGATMISSRDIVEITISIHAPTRGATWLTSSSFSCVTISIHAPTRGATSSDPDDRYRRVDFNPRSYKRSDNCRGEVWVAAYRFQSTLLQEERQG